MRFKECQFMPKKRRGLSSVVGALLFVVLMVATFAVLGVALDSQTEIVDTGRDVANIGLKKQQEDFIINSVIQNPGDVLQVHATNNGQNVAEMFTLVITNSSDIAEGYPTQTYEIPSDTSFLAPGDSDTTDIVSTLDLKLDNAAPAEKDTYSFKVISSLGTIKKLSIQCDENGLCGQTVGSGGSGGLAVSLFLDGPNGVNTKTTTVIMFVSNIGDVPLEDIHPVRNCPDYGNFFPDITNVPPAPGLAAFDPCNLQPVFDPNCGSGAAGNNDGNGICLVQGQTGIFKWDGEVAGDIGDVFQFCNEVVGQEWDDTDVGPSNTDCDEMTVIDPNDCGGCGPGGDPIVLLDDLLVRPELFMIIPGPFGLDAGTDPGQAIWGVNVVNPTEESMDVGKVTMVSYPPGANANHLVFDPINCNLNEIEPIGNWSCAGENTIMWESILAPITIGPYSSQSFLVKVDPGKIQGSVDLDALIVQANAFTTTGSFGKAGYQTTMYGIPETMVNIFLTDADLGIPEDPTDDSHIFSQRLGIQDLVAEEFKITLADMDEDNDTFIKKDSIVVINVPRLWTDVVITDDTNFVGCTTCPPLDDNRITAFADSSTQILLRTDVDIGGDINGNDLQDHLTVTFTANPPDNKGQLFKPYIMYVLAYGETGLCIPDNPNPCIPKPRPIGPLSEIYLQVID